MAERKRKSNGDESGGGGAPGWMVTYGDLMSLLLTFFVLLLSFSSIQEVEFQKALGSLKGALGVLPKQPSVIFQVRPYYPRLKDIQDAKFREKAKELRKMVKDKALSDQLYMEINDEGILIRIDSPVLFALGDGTLKREAYPIMDKIAEIIQNWGSNIRIEGHTDDLPIHTSQYPSNWELSTDRALSVLRYLLQNGNIDPKRLSAAGYGEYHPLLPNDSAANRAKNRRVEIYVEREKPTAQFKEEIY